LVVRPLHQDNRMALLPLLNHWVEGMPYTARFTTASSERDIFGASPATVHALKWQQNRHFGVWLGSDLLGFVDVATGFTPEMVPGSRPKGFLRFLALPWIQAHRDLVDRAGALLLFEAERFWREYGVREAVAFALDAGYPSFQGGAGVLPGEWSSHFRVLTEAGYHLADRYYCLHRTIHTLLEEQTPGLRLSLSLRGSDRDRHYTVYRRAEQVARARLLHREVDHPAGVNPVAVLVHFEVEPDWRSKGLGKWLLRRLINDATLQGYRRMVYHVHPENHVAIYLFSQNGFQEMDFRGYVFTKQLLPQS
jgi:ribosomal protein S18 acetylase RimI-like enzyme